MAIKLQAKADYVFCKPTEAGTPSDFAKVESQPRQHYFEVVSVGEEVKNCKVGDKIVPFGNQFQAIVGDGTVEKPEFIVIQDDLVSAVIDA